MIGKTLCENLIQIPPYHYWEMPNGAKFASYKNEILQVGKEYDLDLSLVCHAKFLERVHNEFFRAYDETKLVDIKPVIRKCIKTVFNPAHLALFEFLFKKEKPPTEEELMMTYEGSKCIKYGLSYSHMMTYDPSELTFQLYMLPDSLSSGS